MADPIEQHATEKSSAPLSVNATRTGKLTEKPQSNAGDSPELEQGELDEGEDEEAVMSKADHNGASEPSAQEGTADTPPLPDEALPPLPNEAPPAAVTEADDGWAPIWEESAQAFYFYNRFTGASQWTNPRVPDPVEAKEGPPGVVAPAAVSLGDPPLPATATTGYNPAIHGDYDPTAWYAQPAAAEISTTSAPQDPAAAYAATAAFNRFTGRFQSSEITPELHNDENKSKRQMSAFFDVDSAANSHDGRSLKAERSGKKLTKTELKQFKDKRKAKKEEKRRAWLLS